LNNLKKPLPVIDTALTSSKYWHLYSTTNQNI